MKNKFIEDILHSLLECNIREMIEEIGSDKYDWNGYANGDTESKYQARKCIQTAMVLLITSRVISMEDNLDRIIETKRDIGITLEEARELFYDHIRHLSNKYNGSWANSGIRFDVIPNMYKYVANYLPSKKEIL